MIVLLLNLTRQRIKDNILLDSANGYRHDRVRRFTPADSVSLCMFIPVKITIE